jgi:hypothetical protein
MRPFNAKKTAKNHILHLSEIPDFDMIKQIEVRCTRPDLDPDQDHLSLPERQAMTAPESITSKRCSKCGLVKLITDFKIDRHKASGRGSHCKACSLAATLRWHEATREQKGIKKRVESVDPWLVRPDTPILDTEGRDWTWAFVIFKQPNDFPGYLLGSDGGFWSQLGVIGLGGGRGCASVLTGRWRRKKLAVDQDGYLFANLYMDGKSHPRRFARLMLETFIGPCPEGEEACHNNGDRTDNRLSNIRWDTPESNLEDRDRHGTTARGEKQGVAKIVTADVHEIFRMREAGLSYSRIAQTIGLSKRQAMRIAKGESWAHIDHLTS